KLRSDEDIWNEISSSSASETKKSKNVVQDESSKDVKETNQEIKENMKNHPEHRVHFDFDEACSSSSESDPDAPLSLKFKFTTTKVTPKFAENIEYLTPWDIGNNHKKKKQHGILKAESKKAPIQTGNSGSFPAQIPRIPPKRQNTAFGDDILERNVVSQTCKPPTRAKGSLFKQRRLRS
ncbi:unnamed protein product, partial [Oikopleura dioica]